MQKENVICCAGECALTIMPHLGGKIASLRVGAHELLQAPLQPYAPRTQTMTFDEGDASGWDECLPSVSQCKIQTAAGEAHIPDHGDLWRVPWKVLSSDTGSATLRANCFSLPLQLTRTVVLDETPTGFKLQLLYSLTNMGAYVVPWAWSAHPLFAVDPGDRIALDDGQSEVEVEGSAGGTLGSKGERIPWPRVRRIDGTNSDLSITQSSDSGIGDKVFAGPFGHDDNFASLERRQIGLRLTVRSGSLTPYLGLWLCYGGWPEVPGPKQVCVALEPTTANDDSLAGAALWSKWLDPGETVTWPMELHIDRTVFTSQSPADQQEEYT